MLRVLFVMFDIRTSRLYISTLNPFDARRDKTWLLPFYVRRLLFFVMREPSKCCKFSCPERCIYIRLFLRQGSHRTERALR